MDPQKAVCWFARQHQTAVRPFLMPADFVRLPGSKPTCILISRQVQNAAANMYRTVICFIVVGYGHLCHTL